MFVDQLLYVIELLDSEGAIVPNRRNFSQHNPELLALGHKMHR